MCTRQRFSLLLLGGLLLTFSGRAVYAEDIDLEAVPPFLLEGVAPNLVLTLDNSDSMDAAYLPNNLKSLDERAMFSSPDVNGVYYDPSKTYLPGLNADGTSMGNAEFSTGAPPLPVSSDSSDPPASYVSPYLGCADDVVNLATDYDVLHEADYSVNCPTDADYSDNPNAAAFYHLYDPNNRFYDPGDLNSTTSGSDVVCNPAADGEPCTRCGDEFDGPDKDTPDACFDRVLVGGAADFLIAKCTDVPNGFSGITAQDAYADTGDYSTATDLVLTGRIAGETCEARGDDSALGNVAVDIAKTNFANWYRYHRTRLLVTKTALSRVMQTLNGGVRLAYQGMREGEMWDSPTGAFADLALTFDSYSGSKDNFYQWMFGLNTSTDLETWLGVSHVRAGEFVACDLAQADDIDAYRAAPNDFANNSCGLKCRNNFHLMFTDGGWEDLWGSGLAIEDVDEPRSPCSGGGDIGGCWISANQDGGSQTLPQNSYGISGYDPGPAAATQVFSDANIGMLADIVFYYWRNDLRADAVDQVPPLLPSWDGAQTADSAANFWNPLNDPATWQHLSFYAVGLGVDGAVTPSNVSPFGTYQIGESVKTLVADGFPDGSPSPYTDEGNPAEINPDGPFTSVGAPSAYSRMFAETIPYQAKVDDLYHATLNGRGRYYNASDAQDLISSFADVLDTVSSAAEPKVSNASVAVSTAQLGDETLQFQIIVDATNWRGELHAYQVSMGLGKDPCATKPRGELCETGGWTAPQDMVANDRQIITLAPGTAPASRVGLAFRSGNFSALSRAQQLGLLGCGAETGDVWSGDKAHCNAASADLATDYQAELQLAQHRMDYLRGDASKETGANAAFRERDGHWLGDIINSNALVVTAPKRVFNDADYLTFRNSADVSDRADVVYVGANDGMLHAFNAANGQELFAYVPEAIYPHLSDLTLPGYGAGSDGGTDPLLKPKGAFVDGPLASADAIIDSRITGTDTGWRTVLLGSLGLGAQGVYALDVTKPGTITEDTASDLPLWEFTDASGSDDGTKDGRDMGYSLAPPAIVRIDNDLTDAVVPTWVALISNGYNNTNVDDELPGNCTDTDTDTATNCTVSQTGNAVLYVLRLGGTDATRILERLDTGRGFCQDPRVATGNLPGSDCDADARGRTNALGPVTPVDLDGDLIADLAYAGDLFGNLWRFDLVNLSADNNPTLLFSAKDANGVAQPITSAVAVQRHPTGLGVMVLFGTGQYLNANDKTDLQVQTFYGIWDDGGRVYGDGSYVVPTRGNPGNPGNLLEQQFKATALVQEAGGSTTVSLGRTSTNLTIDWSNGLRGWYIDLKLENGLAEGERVVVAPQLRGSRVVFVSVIPEDCCSSGGLSWINALDFKDGSRLAYTPFDYNLDGGFGADDKLSIVDANGPSQVVGSSIRILTDGGTGVYSAPSQLGLGGGQLQSIVSDSEGDLILLRESTALEWRNWVQLQ